MEWKLTKSKSFMKSIDNIGENLIKRFSISLKLMLTIKIYIYTQKEPLGSESLN